MLQRLGDGRVAGASTRNVNQINKVGRRRSHLRDQPLVIEVAVVTADNTQRIVALACRGNNLNLIAMFSTFFLHHCNEAIKLQCFAPL